jgi:hypothetical protein
MWLFRQLMAAAAPNAKAISRITKEFKELTKEPAAAVSVDQADGLGPQADAAGGFDMFSWKAKLIGPPDSPYQCRGYVFGHDQVPPRVSIQGTRGQVYDQSVPL